MKFEQVSTAACETIYKVEYQGETIDLRLWAIVGGTIALDFKNYGFSQRYHVDERFSRKNQVKNQYGSFHCYRHQNTQNPIGPQIGDSLSVKDVKAFLDKNVPLRNLRKARTDIIKSTVDCPLNNVRSGRFHNASEREYFHLTICTEYATEYARVSRVGYESAHGFRVISTKLEYADDFWRKAVRVCDKLVGDKCQRQLEELSEPEFQEYLALFREWNSIHRMTRDGRE